MLLPLAGLCMDAAVNRFIIRERLGTKEIREQAFGELEKAEEVHLQDGSARVNLTYRKVRTTPPQYPRAYAKIKKSPL